MIVNDNKKIYKSQIANNVKLRAVITENKKVTYFDCGFLYSRQILRFFYFTCSQLNL